MQSVMQAKPPPPAPHATSYATHTPVLAVPVTAAVPVPDTSRDAQIARQLAAGLWAPPEPLARSAAPDYAGVNSRGGGGGGVTADNPWLPSAAPAPTPAMPVPAPVFAPPYTPNAQPPTHLEVSATQTRAPPPPPAPPTQPPALPPGWEQQKTPDGEVYYVNHNDRSTHWALPDGLTGDRADGAGADAAASSFGYVNNRPGLS